MRKIASVILIGMMVVNTVLAQAPHTFNYQTIVRDSIGNVISNQSLSFRISILQDNINGSVVYTEIHSATTNQFGMTTLKIGMGTIVTGNFEGINWGSTSNFLKVELDDTGNSNYQLMGTTQLLSVPYSLNAGSLTLTSPSGIHYEITVDDFGNLLADCFPDPTDANAGIDQDSVCIPTYLQANTPQSGQGVWSIISGNGGSISNPNDPLSEFTGIPGNTYTLQWTITNECGFTEDELVISFMTLPTIANAGPDQLNVTLPATLAANAPGYGTGLWSIIDGTGGSITDPSNPGSTFAGMPDSTYTLRWTISTACDNSSDEVDISFAGSGGPCPTTVNDIEGNSYSTVLIGNQCWMKSNLRTETYNNGTAIPNVTGASAWQNLTIGAFVYYENNVSWKSDYGLLYNWFAATSSHGLCPTGWHVPSESEWAVFNSYVGGFFAGPAIKSCRQVNSPYGAGCNTTLHPRWDAIYCCWGTDDFGFSALPSGYREYYGTFYNLGSETHWWSSTTYTLDPNQAKTRGTGLGNNEIWTGPYDKNRGIPVRCIKD